MKKNFDQLVDKELTFPDGSYHCQLFTITGFNTVVVKMQNFDLVQLATQKNALNLHYPNCKHELFLPYVPAARQDRVCNIGEPLTVKVIADLINFLQFDKVTILDPHSDVLPALLNNVEIMKMENVLFNHGWSPADGSVFVSPDAGAIKRTTNFANFFNAPMVEANKKRRLSDGAIERIEVNQDLDPDIHYIVVDDVCAMGGTFLGLEKAMKDAGAKSYSLILSHVDANNGIGRLSGYKQIITTNSQPHDLVTDGNLSVIDLF